MSGLRALLCLPLATAAWAACAPSATGPPSPPATPGPASPPAAPSPPWDHPLDPLRARAVAPVPAHALRGAAETLRERLVADEAPPAEFAPLVWPPFGPELSVDGTGSVTVRWHTPAAETSGRLNLMVAPDAPWTDPVPRAVVPARPISGGPMGSQHVASADLGRLEHPLRDIGGLAGTGGPLVARIQQSVLGAEELVDLPFAYARTDDGATTRALALDYGPAVELPTPDGFTVALRCDAPCLAMALTHVAGTTRRHLSSRGVAREHEIQVRGLPPDTRVSYSVVAAAQGLPAARPAHGLASTAPSSPRTARFAVLSDSRASAGGEGRAVYGVNTRALDRLFDTALAQRADLAVFVGDLVDGYVADPLRLAAELRSFRRRVARVGRYLPVLELPGNHDRVLFASEDGTSLPGPGGPTTESIFTDLFTLPTGGPDAADGAPPYGDTAWTFDYAGVQLVAVNSNYWTSSAPHIKGNREGLLRPEQLEWLDRTLAAGRDRGVRHQLVFTHEPAFPVGGHARDAMYWDGAFPEVLAARDRFLHILARHRVAALFHGDEHNYSRLTIDDTLVPGLTHPIVQVVSGGAGAPPYARDHDVPWDDRVQAFASRRHLVLVEADAASVQIRAIDLHGVTLDRVRIPAPAD